MDGQQAEAIWNQFERVLEVLVEIRDNTAPQEITAELPETRHYATTPAPPALDRPHVEKALDTLDACIFTGDAFDTPQGIARLRWYMARWERQLKRNEEIG